MPRLHSVVLGRMASVIACTALVGQAAVAGTIVLHNQLPFPAACVVETVAADALGIGGANPQDYTRLLDTQLAAGAEQVVVVADGTWPAELGFDAQGVPFTASRQFGALSVRCHLVSDGADGSEYRAHFIHAGGNPGHAQRVGAGSPAGHHALQSYAPTDRTAFTIQLRPTRPTADAEELLTGAPLSLALFAMPLLHDGSPLQIQAFDLGRYDMARSPAASATASAAAWNRLGARFRAQLTP